MATGHDDDDDDDDDDNALADDDDDHLRVACYPRAPLSNVTLGRPCHMSARYGTSDGKGTSNLNGMMGPGPKFERPQVL